MKIEILGTGCSKCEKLAANTELALKELGISAETSKVTEIAKIVEYGVMMVPALAVDGVVVAYGKVLSKEEIKKILEENRGR